MIERGGTVDDRNEVSAWLPKVIFAVYVLVTAMAVIFHEPWRDEAQKWLIARDCESFGEFLRLMPLEGSPGLWAALLVPFAKVGLPYGTVAVLNWVFVCGVAWLVWFRSGLPVPLRAAFLASYFVVYDLPVVARNYGLGAFLLFCAIALYRDRTERPLRYAGILVLLMNTNVFGIAQGAVLGLILVWDLYTDIRLIRPLVPCALVIGVGLAVAGGQLLKLSGGGSVNEVLSNADRETLVHTLGVNYPWTKLLGSLGLEISFVLALAAIAALAVFLLRSWRALALFAASLALPAKLLASNYTAPQYLGIVLSGAVAAIWMTKQDAENRRCGLYQWRNNRAFDVFGGAGVWSVVGALGFSAVFGIRDMVEDFRLEYSGARAMADYIEKQRLGRLPIAVFRDTWGSALSPYLPWKKLYYPGANRFGTFIIQDARHQANDFLSHDTAITRAFAEFKHQPRFLLISNARLTLSDYPDHFRFLHEIAKPAVISDEEYFLYECFPGGDASLP